MSNLSALFVASNRWEKQCLNCIILLINCFHLIPTYLHVLKWKECQMKFAIWQSIGSNQKEFLLSVCLKRISYVCWYRVLKMTVYLSLASLKVIDSALNPQETCSHTTICCLADNWRHKVDMKWLNLYWHILWIKDNVDKYHSVVKLIITITGCEMDLLNGGRERKVRMLFTCLYLIYSLLFSSRKKN